uniref:Uncharacterized protein n=1 Tax=Romanomermis culicivorax TaxID=13658 RepID=A0A915K4P4_ROMCU
MANKSSESESENAGNLESLQRELEAYIYEKTIKHEDKANNIQTAFTHLSIQDFNANEHFMHIKKQLYCRSLSMEASWPWAPYSQCRHTQMVHDISNENRIDETELNIKTFMDMWNCTQFFRKQNWLPTKIKAKEMHGKKLVKMLVYLNHMMNNGTMKLAHGHHQQIQKHVNLIYDFFVQAVSIAASQCSIQVEQWLDQIDEEFVHCTESIY